MFISWILFKFIIFRLCFSVIALLFIKFSCSDGVVLDCEFIYIKLMNIKEIYKCKAQNLSVESKDERVTGVNGQHAALKTVGDVQILIIENQVCKYLPKDLQFHFPNLYHLDIRNSGLKSVNSEDMKMFLKLKHLYIRNNLVEVIPEDLFLHNLLLEFINLNDNKIKQISLSAFDSLNHLISVSIERNICIDDFGFENESLNKLKDKITKN